MVEQVYELKGALEASVRAGVLSRPHILDLPSALPFRAAVVTMLLPDGCVAPSGPLALRVGSGVGHSEDTAILFALTEAAERYTLQYSPGRPPHLDPVWTAGGRPEAADILDLTLGAPGRPEGSSHGAAAGVHFEDAAERALFETLEHHHVGEMGELSGDFLDYDLRSCSTIASYLQYLSDQLRKLEIAVHVSPYGYVAVRALCHDFDGGRPTMGSAAGRDFGGSIKRAAEEAILLWRNMIEIERRGISLAILQGGQKNKIRVYRGAHQLEINMLDRAQSAAPDIPPIRTTLHDVVQAVTGLRVRVFDMTDGDVAVPVARVFLD